MDKYEQLKREYHLLEKSCKPFLDPAGTSEFEFYIETAMLRIWSANGRYSEDYAKAVQAISGKMRTPVQITRAMLDSIEPAEISKIPAFFARIVAEDFEKGSHRTKDFVVDLKSLLAGAAFINGDFTIEESNMLSTELKKLMTYAISQGVKVDYASGRIHEKVTPLKEDSYMSPDAQATVSAELMFDALDRDFLRPGGSRRAGGSDVAGPIGGSSDTNVEVTTGNASANQSTVEVKEDTRSMEELLDELDALVGLTGIKEDIRSLMNFITITKLRQERGLNVPTISYHLVFTGNPGTGKTTVARLVAGLYHRIGILPKGQLVETDRSQLVAGYTGQTAIKTMDVINQAMGGVLFIDEAYSLVNDDQDSFGKECVETILKSMEDHRNELVVIVAGYTELMHKFIESNPGFRSRFSKFFEFPDYTGDELLQIFLRFCEKNGYHLTAEAESYLLLQLNDMYEHRDPHFGNGRTARNIFEKAIHQQANRLAGIVDPAATGETADTTASTEDTEDATAKTADAPASTEDTEVAAAKTADAPAEPLAAEHISDSQLQELTRADLEAAIEAEMRKITI